MPTIIDSLGFSVDTSEVRRGEKDLDNFGKTAEKTGKKTNDSKKATEKLSSAFRELVAPLLAAVSAYSAFHKLVSEARQIGVFNASLETATGSAQNAAIAFQELQRIAAQTPFTLDQSVEGFIKLVNLGLDPSEKALISYGNTAAAMGKDLNQMIEAVADAATGEFERLKEFGIKSAKQGDQVAFTFRGITKTVGINSKEIENYLVALGENEFNAAMTKRMQTVDGAISNLHDNWDSLFRSINNQGVGNLIYEGTVIASNAIEYLINLLESGALTVQLTAIAGKFSMLGDVASEVVDYISNMYSLFFRLLGTDAESASKFFIDAFRNMPENIAAFVKLMTIEIKAFVDKTAAYGKEILENLQFWKDETFDLDSALAEINSQREYGIAQLSIERDTAIKSYDAQIKKSDELVAAYKKAQAERKAVDLGQFRTGGTAAAQPSQEKQDATDKLLKDLASDEDALSIHLANRLALIDQNIQDEDTRNRLRLEAIKKFEDESYKLTKAAEDKKTAARQASYEATASILSSLGSIIESRGRGGFENAKKLARAETIISTYAAAQKAYESQIIPGDPTSVARGALAATASVLAGLARLQKINSTTYDSGTASASGGGGSVGGSAPSAAPSPATPNISQQQKQTNVFRIQIGDRVLDEIVVEGVTKAIGNQSVVLQAGNEYVTVSHG